MGVDFIREEAGKPWRKRWDKGLNRLKTPGLFDLHFSDQHRVLSVDLEPGCNLKPGDQVVVECSGQSAIVCSGQHRIGSVGTVPADVRAAMTHCGSVALGTIERIGIFGTNAELSIR